MRNIIRPSGVTPYLVVKIQCIWIVRPFFLISFSETQVQLVVNSVSLTVALQVVCRTSQSRLSVFREVANAKWTPDGKRTCITRRSSIPQTKSLPQNFSEFHQNKHITYQRVFKKDKFPFLFKKIGLKAVSQKPASKVSRFIRQNLSCGFAMSTRWCLKNTTSTPRHPGACYHSPGHRQSAWSKPRWFEKWEQWCSNDLTQRCSSFHHRIIWYSIASLMLVIATTSCLQYLLTEAMAGLFKCVKRASDAKPSRLSACESK